MKLVWYYVLLNPHQGANLQEDEGGGGGKTLHKSRHWEKTP